MKSSPLSLQLEKSFVQQRRPRAAKKEKKKGRPIQSTNIDPDPNKRQLLWHKVIFRSVLPVLEEQTNKELCDNVTSVIKRCVNVLCG